MRRRHRGALVALVLSVLGLAATGLAGPAAAGGPTSVLLVAPQEGRTASLYTGSPDYEELFALVGGSTVSDGSTTPPKSVDLDDPGVITDQFAREVTLTWLIHDVSIWRIDQIFLDAEGGPWMSTRMTSDFSTPTSELATWQVVPRGAELEALLDRLGVSPSGSVTPEPVARPDASTPAVAAAVPASTPAAASTGDADAESGSVGWVWAVIGVLAGVLLGAAGAGLLLGRRAGRHDSPPDEERHDREDRESGVETLSSHSPGRS